MGLVNRPHRQRPTRDEASVYSASRYDEHLTLKVPALLWLTLAFLVRHLLLLGITFLPTTGSEITLLRDLIRPEYLLAYLIALPVLIVAMRRRPRSPSWMRRLWPHGRRLLTLSILVYLGLLARGVMTSGLVMLAAIDELALTSLLTNLAALQYLWRSALVRDCFRQFPPPPDSP